MFKSSSAFFTEKNKSRKAEKIELMNFKKAGKLEKRLGNSLGSLEFSNSESTDRSSKFFTLFKIFVKNMLINETWEL